MVNTRDKQTKYFNFFLAILFDLLILISVNHHHLEMLFDLEVKRRMLIRLLDSWNQRVKVSRSIAQQQMWYYFDAQDLLLESGTLCSFMQWHDNKILKIYKHIHVHEITSDISYNIASVSYIDGQ